MNELSERERRKQNYFWIVENNDCENNSGQLELDRVTVSDILSTLGVNSENDLKLIRLGKFDVTNSNRKRPTKATLPAEHIALKVLRGCSQLKSISTSQRVCTVCGKSLETLK